MTWKHHPDAGLDFARWWGARAWHPPPPSLSLPPFSPQCCSRVQTRGHPLPDSQVYRGWEVVVDPEKMPLLAAMFASYQQRAAYLATTPSPEFIAAAAFDMAGGTYPSSPAAAASSGPSSRL
jgi:hypothetical protein